jgi:hypothetical protein
MKKTLKLFLFWLILPFIHFIANAQSCSPEAMTAKYWQYRKQFNEHFIAIDRKPDGCIGNGITDPDQPASDQRCGISFLKGGYSLPATSIVMQPEGTRGIWPRSDTSYAFYDSTCSGGTSVIGNPNHKFNHLNMGSETSHQLGWYLVTLSTEYELLRISGETEEMERTLEEIFLALQAYKRLDMLANCLARERYDEITDGFEVEKCDPDACPLCNLRYCTDKHRGAKKYCDKNCDWTPDLSGTTGFFLREDATQELENLLHDDSEDQWNIDLISSDNALSQKPPCSSTFSQACYLYHRQNFGSIDQLIEIMKGLAFIKRYIPKNATVTTCDGHLSSISNCPGYCQRLH